MHKFLPKRNITWKLWHSLHTYIFLCMYGSTIWLISFEKNGYFFYYMGREKYTDATWIVRPESLNTTLNTTVDSAMIEAQIEPQIIQTKLAPQLSSQVQQISKQQMLVENNTDLANSGSVSEKATEILNGWEGYVLVIVCVSRKRIVLDFFSFITFYFQYFYIPLAVLLG